MATKEKETPTGEKEQQGRGGGVYLRGKPSTCERERELLLKRETEHLWLRQLMHGIGGGPR
jgi:hypothetical protein